MPINPDYIFFIWERVSLCLTLFVSGCVPSPSHSLSSRNHASFSELQLDTAISLHCVCIILSNAGHYESAWKTRLIQRTKSEELLARGKWGQIYRGNYLTNEHFTIEDLCCNDFCHSQCVLSVYSGTEPYVHVRAPVCVHVSVHILPFTFVLAKN